MLITYFTTIGIIITFLTISNWLMQHFLHNQAVKYNIKNFYRNEEVVLNYHIFVLLGSWSLLLITGLIPVINIFLIYSMITGLITRINDYISIKKSLN